MGKGAIIPGILGILSIQIKAINQALSLERLTSRDRVRFIELLAKKNLWNNLNDLVKKIQELKMQDDEVPLVLKMI